MTCKGTTPADRMEIGRVDFLSAPRAGRPDSVPLAGRLYALSTAQDLTPGLVVGHGAGSRSSSHDEFCRVACAAGFTVLALDFRGHGDSGGFADGPLELDVLAAARFLRALPSVDADRLVYRGSSMGGFYGLKAARQAGFAALALLCPASERVILDGIDEREAARPAAENAVLTESEGPPFWDTPGLRHYFERQDSLAEASLLNSPVLLVHARADAVVPFENSLQLAAALAGPVTLLALPGGSHTSAQHDPAIHRATVDWLSAQVRAPVAAGTCAPTAGATAPT